MKKILIIAAENSAEKYAGQVVECFNTSNSKVQFFGVGGDSLQKKGVNILIHSTKLAIVGIIEVISSIWKIKKYMKFLHQYTIREKADAAFLIDFPDFNLRLAKKLHRSNIPVYFYISPTIWAWRYKRIKLIKKYIKHIFIIFPFEIDIFQKEKISFTYTGHPLLPSIKTKLNKEEVRKKYHLGQNQYLISLLPGSRKSEIEFLLPTLLKAAENLKSSFKIKFLLLKADSIKTEFINRYLKEYSGIDQVDQQDGHDIINASDAVITTCGTSNLETALLNTPFVAVYKVNKLSYLLGKGFLKISLYSIVNILAEKQVVRELIQKDFTAKNIVNEIKNILNNPDYREKMLNDFKMIKTYLQQDKNPPELIFQKITSDLGIKSGKL